ncbi:MAG: ROK family protein [Planctomycetes bacterium]|nr:ROK family protein [Planctomycetota bacterium]
MANRFENKVRILDMIRELGRASRPMLSESLDINLPTISNLTKELIDAKLITGDGFEKSEGGRRAELLILNPGFATVIGLEMGLTGIRGVLADLGGNVLDRVQGPDEMPAGKDPMVEALLQVAESLKARAPAQRKPIGVGLAISGLTDENGRISREFPHREDWKDIPLAQQLEQRLGIPAQIGNDVQAATLAERRHGGARGMRDMLFLSINQGIACGIVVDGRLYVGATRNAGEFGHTIVDPSGPICYCGNYGCLESLASPSAVLDQALQAIRKGVQSSVANAANVNGKTVNTEAVFRAADDGDRLATNVVTRAGEYIGLGLANLVNFFNPELIVFGGEVLVHGYRVFNEAIERTFRARVLPILQQPTRIIPSALGRDAAAVGGSMLIFESLFDEPDKLFAVSEGRALPLGSDEEARGRGGEKARARGRKSPEKDRIMRESEQRISRWRRWAVGRPAAKEK